MFGDIFWEKNGIDTFRDAFAAMSWCEFEFCPQTVPKESQEKLT